MAAQSERIKILIDVDASRARAAIKRVIKEANEANREIAQLQDNLDTLGGRLARYGIGFRTEGGQSD